MAAELFDLVNHSLAPLSTLAQPVTPKPTPDASLRWTEMDLDVRGWCLHLGYSASGDPFDDGDITLKRIILNTGQREVDLAAADLDGDTWLAAEDQCREHWQKSYVQDSPL